MKTIEILPLPETAVVVQETRIVRFSKWLLPRIISWGTVAFIIYCIITGGNISSFDDNRQHLIAYHIIGLSIFGLVTNQEAVLHEKQTFLSCLENKNISYYGTQFMGLITSGAGMVAIYYNYDVTDWFTKHLYSPHAWLGASTILTWCARQMTGLFMPSYTRLNTSLVRASYGMGLVTCMLGFQSKQMSDMMIANTSNVSNIAPNSWLSVQSSLSVVLIAASGVITWLWL